MSEEPHPISFFGDEKVEDDCPYCLETMPIISWRGDERTGLPCCGKYCCRECGNNLIKRLSVTAATCASICRDPRRSDRERKKLKEHLKILSLCPLCRQPTWGHESKNFQNYLRRAKAGSLRAQFDVACQYENGIGVEIDLKEAVRWYKKASEQNVVAAMFRYGTCLHLGSGCKKLQSEAVHWMERAADTGYPPAQDSLGMFYIWGDGVEVDFEKGINLLKQSSDQGWVMGQANLADLFMHGYGIEKNPAEALRLHKLAAEEGHPRSLYEVGRWYSESCPKKDYKKGFQYMKRSVESGNRFAKVKLGNLYRLGLGVEKNTDEALRLYESAAAEGLPHAHYELGMWYMKRSEEINFEKGLQLLKLSADRGYSEAQYELAQMYRSGDGVERDANEGMRLMRLAAENGRNKDAQFELGMWNLKARNEEQGLHWLKLSADQGNTKAMCVIGKICIMRDETGDSLVNRAVKWWRIAANLNDEAAIKYLADYEVFASSQCAYCHRKKTADEKLLRCSKCKIKHYCSKGCQKRHWKAGHKIDCSDE